MKYKAEVIQTKSIAEVLEYSTMPKWRKWLLRKLIPEEFYELPPQKLATLQKGESITMLTMEVTDMSNADINIGM